MEKTTQWRLGAHGYVYNQESRDSMGKWRYHWDM